MIQKSCEVIDINSKRHDLPLEVILFHMVDFSKIHSLPVNQDCTSLLNIASRRVLKDMFSGGKFYIETFMPRRQEFEALLAEELAAYKSGEWKMPSVLNDNAAVSL